MENIKTNNINYDENLAKLQEEMRKHDIKSYIIFSTDYHNSEYCHPSFLNERFFYCSFTGTDGTLLVTQDDCFIYTDGRYWVQAEKELKGTKCKLCKMGDPSCIEMEQFIKENKLFPCAFDYRCISIKNYERFNNIKTMDMSFSYLINSDLKDTFGCRPIWKLDTQFKSKYSIGKEKENKKDKTTCICEKLCEDKFNLVGETTDSKIKRICKFIKENDGDALLLTSLDDIAYVLNCRSDDIPNNPVFYAYLFINKDGTYKIFIKDRVHPFNPDDVLPYEEIDNFLRKTLNGDGSYSLNRECPTILLDNSKVNFHLGVVLGFTYKNVVNPSYLMKAVKNETEISNIRRIHEYDGIALLKFANKLRHLEPNTTEYDLCLELKDYRLKYFNNCYDESFPSIIAFKDNGPMMHYEPTKENSKVVSEKDKGLLLVDSGGQYYGGTTDVTRTFFIGKNPSKEEITDYTLTLKSLINLTNTIFIDGCSGTSIDIKAREIMWRNGMDYKCGTGHGVGYMLNVHEGPNGFRYRVVPERMDSGKLVCGMVTTIEPGVYKTGKYGIRLENELLVVPHSETTDGVFYTFETLTYFPFERNLIDKSMLNESEIEFINNYHKMVREKLYKYVSFSQELSSLLLEMTEEI